VISLTVWKSKLRSRKLYDLVMESDLLYYLAKNFFILSVGDISI
jgi:hypothetical protein